MCSKRCGRAPHSVGRSATCAGLIGLMALLAGCASNTTQSSSSAAAPMNMASARIPMEADGLPVQLAPRDRSPIADDPREPWSPNYGSVPPTRTSALPHEAAAPPAARSVAPAVAPAPLARIIQLTSTRPMDAEDIIRRAVAAHEMRQEN